MDRKTTHGGLDLARLDLLRQAIAQDISADKYLGASIIVARHGEIGLAETLGTARSDDPAPLASDAVFSLFSLTKAFTNVLMLMAVDRGLCAFTTKVSDILPEFLGGPRANIRIDHLLTHRIGMPSVFTPRPGMPINDLDQVIEATIKGVMGVEEPGERVTYAPIVAHVIMAAVLRRIDPARRSYRQMVEDEILAPLGLKDTAVGVRRDLKARHVVPELPAMFPATHPSSNVPGPHGAFEDETAEMPWVGIVSTPADIFRFAEMLRRGGELDGQRLLSPRIVSFATTNQTGDRPNELYKGMALNRGWTPFPAYMGLGFFLRGEAICHHQFGTLTTPRTFGNYGAGSTLYWVDPDLGMTFVCLTTRLMPEPENIMRFQRLSDLAVAAAL